MNFINEEKKYHTYSDYLKRTFGKKVFKVALNGHFTCPNKDGLKGRGGCIYCSPSGSGDFAGDLNDDLYTQFHTVKSRMHEKWPDAYYIAYFQANTNTYKDVDTLREMFEYSLTLDDHIVGLSIATRPDALDQEKVAMLYELSKKTVLQVELGLQSIHEDTSIWMNRGHDLACFNQAVKMLRDKNIDVVVHIINGFPNEDKAMMLETVKHLNTLQVQGIKIHMLHVMEKTLLGTMYKQHPFKLLTLEEYVDIVVTQLEHLDPKIIVQRVTGDSPKEMLIAPVWTLRKFVVMNEIDKLMRKKNTYQGIFYK
jgi:uncharacterized protein